MVHNAVDGSVPSVEPLDPDSSRIRASTGPAAARIAAVAARQHGVITFGQAVAAGLSPASVHRWAAGGHLHRLHHGVYAVGHANVTREGCYLAAVLAGGTGAALSHQPAARLLGLDLTKTVGTIHISMPRGDKRSPRGVVVHRPRSLDPIDLARRRGIPTTTETRTLFDQAALLAPSALRAQFERAEYLETLDRARLEALLSGATGRRGLGELRRLAGFEPIPLNRTRSRLERLILSLCRTHSLPAPAVNVPLLDYEVDFLWADARLVVEADGGHHRGEQRAKDNHRDLALQLAGHLVRRYSEEALRDEEAVAAELLGVLRLRLDVAT